MLDNPFSNMGLVKQIPELIQTSKANKNDEYNPNLLKSPYGNSQSSIFFRN